MEGNEGLESTGSIDQPGFDEIGMDAFNAFQPEPEPKSNDGEQPPATPVVKEDKQVSEPVKAESVADGEKGDEGASDTDSNPNLYSSVSSALVQDGVLSTFDTEKNKIESAEDLIGAIKQEIENNEYSDLNDTQKEYLTALRTGVPMEEYKQAISMEEQLNSITDAHLTEDADLRKSIITQDFLNKGFSEARAAQQTQLSIDAGRDEEDAKLALADIQLKSREAIQAKMDSAAADQKAENDKIAADKASLKKTVFDATEYIEGMPINEEIKKAVYDSITKQVGEVDGKGLNKVMAARAKDPVNFDAKLHYFYHITNGFKDFDKVKATQKSSAVSELDRFIKSNTHVPGSNDVASQISDNNAFDGFSDATEIR